MTTPKVAYRHRCLTGWRDRVPSLHTARNGRPRSKRCTYCSGQLVTETGLWGVFEWAGDGSYPLDAALRTFLSEPAAQRHADARNTGGNCSTVVRWIYLDAA